MTEDIKTLLKKIEHKDIFEQYPLYFIGGTALSTYLDHRISYDVDIICTIKLPVSAINAFAFSIEGMPVIDSAKASVFRINKGVALEFYHLRYMVDGIKIEFSYFDDSIIGVILEQSTSQGYSEGSKLKKLSLDDIIKLKAVALFSRQKSRDLFDMAILLERKLVSIEDLDRIYSFKKHRDKTLLEYIHGFNPLEDDEDSSLDFLPHHKYYKDFSKLTQDERFEKCKEMLLCQCDVKLKEKLEKKHKEVKSSARKKINIKNSFR